MKDKFEILNDVKIDIDEYKEIKFDDNDEIKSRMKSKIKCRKLNYKKTIVAASLVAILGCGVVSNETVWANVEKMWYTMQRILDFKNEEVTNYKYEIKLNLNQSILLFYIIIHTKMNCKHKFERAVVDDKIIGYNSF